MQNRRSINRFKISDIMKNSNIRKFLVVALLSVLPLCGLSRTVRGDVNSDGCYDINDVTLLTQYVLTSDDSSVNVGACDMNYDHYVDINDIIYLIDKLLKGTMGYCPPPDLTIPEGSVTYTVNGVSFQMVPVEGGTFMMGGTSTLNSPIHQVTLSSYWIGLTEVTVGLWKAVMGSYFLEMHDDDQPAGCLTWYMCQDFIAKLNELTGLNFHLSTEAQWEFAARGGNLSHGYTFAGSNLLSEVGWFGLHDMDLTRMYSVGWKTPNELGLYDMSGSLREVCLDGFEGYPSEPQVDPVAGVGIQGGSIVVRGGSFLTDSVYCAVNSRWPYDKGLNMPENGMRLALGPE